MISRWEEKVFGQLHGGGSRNRRRKIPFQFKKISDLLRSDSVGDTQYIRNTVVAFVFGIPAYGNIVDL